MDNNETLRLYVEYNIAHIYVKYYEEIALFFVLQCN